MVVVPHGSLSAAMGVFAFVAGNIAQGSVTIHRLLRHGFVFLAVVKAPFRPDGGTILAAENGNEMVADGLFASDNANSLTGDSRLRAGLQRQTRNHQA